MALEFTDASVKELVESGKPFVVDFWAEWCGPCRMLTPLIEELAKEYEGKVAIGKLNVDDNQQLASTYGIRGVPTLAFFRDGKEIGRVVGALSHSQLQKVIDEVIDE